jgi:hypothetical protein
MSVVLGIYFFTALITTSGVCFRCFLSLLSLTATISFSMWLVAFYRGFSLMFSCCLQVTVSLDWTLILLILSSFLGCCEWFHTQRLHRKKRFTSFPSLAGMSLTKLPLGRNNSVMTSLFPPRESLVVTSRLGTGNSRTFFYGVALSVSVLVSRMLLYEGGCCGAYLWI